MCVKNCCIRSVNHIHASNSELEEFNDKDIVDVKTSDGVIIHNVHIKKSDNFVLEMHIDTDNSKEYNLVTGSSVFLKK